MKILVIAIPASITVAVIASISLFALQDNRLTCFACPSRPSTTSQPLVENNTSLQNATMQTGGELSALNNTNCVNVSTCDEKLIYFVGSNVKPQAILYDYSYDGIDRYNGVVTISGHTD